MAPTFSFSSSRDRCARGRLIGGLFHDRYHQAPRSLAAASAKQVQTALGCACAVVALKVWAHVWPGDDDRTRSVIDAIFDASVDRVRTDGLPFVQVRNLRASGGRLGLLGGHAQWYQLALDGKQPLMTWGNVFGVIGSDWNLPDSNRTVAGQ